MGARDVIALTILGEPASKANSRKLVKFGERMVSVKSDKALAYERDALRQIPPLCRVRLQGPVAAYMAIYYASERPDLDESLILDILQDRFTGKGEARVLLQAGVYMNDRQVRERHIYHRIDARNPRAEIVIKSIAPQVALIPATAARPKLAPKVPTPPDRFAGVPF